MFEADKVKREKRLLKKRLQSREYYKRNRKRVLERTTKWSNNHPEKRVEYVKKWQNKNREKYLTYTRKWNKSNPEKRGVNQKAYITRHPGIDTKFRQSRKEKLAGRPRPENCEVCNSRGRICFDHDHKTGKFRGWICHGCNSALGYAKDNPKVLKALIRYLRKYQK